LEALREAITNAFQVQFVKTTVTPEVTPEVASEIRLVSVLDGELSRQEIMVRLRLEDEEHFRKVYLVPELESGLIERTIPANPGSSKQKYRLTEKGRSSW
jgi:hypothetical protein